MSKGGLTYGTERGQPSAPPPDLPAGYWTVCADCGDRQPVRRIVEWLGGARLEREIQSEDLRCLACPTRQPLDFSAFTKQTPKPRRRWWRRRNRQQ